MKSIALKAWKFGLALIKNYEEIMSIDEIEEGETYRYVVGENMFESLESIFSELIKESNYIPQNVSLKEMARQITVHYVACIENEPTEEYINIIISFDSVKESAKWFFKNGIDPLMEYDSEI